MIDTVSTPEPVGALDAILNPRSVGIIGASRDPTKRGHQIVRALIDADYRGRIHPVNPAGGELLGLPVAPRIADLDSAPDLAVICTPAHTVPQVLRDCAAAGVRGAIALAVGFGESGSAGGTLEEELQSIVRATGIRLAGPNTSGLLNTATGLNLIGMRNVPVGPLALLVQSGNLTLQLVTEAASRGDYGFRYCIGVGNETDIQFHEYLQYLGSDDSVRAILVHTEGFRSGREFVRVASEVSQRKPIVILKGARTAAGSVVARSHTGAIAGDYAVFQSAMRQAGVIEVTRTDELFHVGQTLASQPTIPLGRGIAVLSDGGGHSALAVDAIGSGRSLAQLADDTRAQLRDLLGPAAAVDNPVDLAGAADADPRSFARALELLAADPAVGAVLIAGLFGGYAIRFASALLDAEEYAARAMLEIAQRRRVALIVHSLYAASRSAPLRSLTAAGVPVIESLEVACRCLTALAAHRPRQHEPTFGIPAIESETGRSAIANAIAEWRTTLLEPEARELVAAHGVPLVPARWCRTGAEAEQAAREFGCAVAIKAVSAAASHKSEAGGVSLDVSADHASRRFAQVTAAVEQFTQAHGHEADAQGALVTPMLAKPLAEVLVGVRRDAQFGPVLVLSAGGSAVELFGQSAVRLLPIVERSADRSRREIGHMQGHIEIMLCELSIARVLAGYRGQPAGDIRGITRVALALADALYAHPALESVEINPLFVYPDRVVAVDARACLIGVPVNESES
jgi:acetate---CoA ligase (ADP-forming)